MVTISHMRMPKLQISLAVVYIWSARDSGAIHLRGNLPAVSLWYSCPSYTYRVKPKSHNFTSFWSATRTLRAAMSRWTNWFSARYSYNLRHITLKLLNGVIWYHNWIMLINFKASVHKNVYLCKVLQNHQQKQKQNYKDNTLSTNRLSSFFKLVYVSNGIWYSSVIHWRIILIWTKATYVHSKRGHCWENSSKLI